MVWRCFSLFSAESSAKHISVNSLLLVLLSLLLANSGRQAKKTKFLFFWGVGILVVGRGKPCYAINFKMAQPLLIWHWKGLSQLPKVPGQRNYFSSATSQFWLCTPLPSLSFVWKHTLVHKELDSFVCFYIDCRWTSGLLYIISTLFSHSFCAHGDLTKPKQGFFEYSLVGSSPTRIKAFVIWEWRTEAFEATVYGVQGAERECWRSRWICCRCCWIFWLADMN